jgi:glutaredoxin/glutathione-dependent peroxiredoxin
MTIKVGDKVPSVKLWQVTPEGVKDVTTDDLFRGKRVALFAVPGAYTRTCSQRHLPSYVTNAAALQRKGIDAVACIAVNDAFVMDAWGKEHGADGKIMMLGDGSADFTRAIGAGMGIRSQRYSMIVDNGTVTALNVEQPGEYAVSSAEAMLEKL